MTTAPADPTSSPVSKVHPSPIPQQYGSSKHKSPEVGDESQSQLSESQPAEAEVGPTPKPSFPAPKLCLECRDLSHAGAKDFFRSTDPSKSLSEAVGSVLSILYTATRTNSHIPPTRSVTLVLRSMDGVAYTTGIELDNDHKQIHFSTDYIASRKPDLKAREIKGVLVHEMVHAWQWNGLGTAPGGLIEGIADFVRLKAGLSPPHWKKELVDNWDQGYQHTAYFLEWIETRHGEGSVRKINDHLKNSKYDEEKFWQRLFGSSVKNLWEQYRAGLEKVLSSEERPG